MPKKQIKQYETQFFDVVAEHGHYELQSESLYSRLFQTIKHHQLSPNGMALECGCGTGAFGRRFLTEFPDLTNIIGVDISERMIDVCRSQNISRYSPMLGDLEDSSLFTSNQFSLIICPFILHHFPTIDHVTQNIGTWIKSGGLLILVEPNGSSPVSFMFKLARKLLEKLMGPKWIIDRGLATPNETDHSVTKYKDALKAIGLEVINIETFTLSQPISRPKSLIGIISLLKEKMVKVLDRILKGTHFAGSTVVIIAKKKC
jgi:SAM-dependent methyltransferase